MMSDGISSAVPKDAHARVATPVRIHSFKAHAQQVDSPKVAKPIPPAVREYLFSTLSAEEARAVLRAGSTGITVAAAFKADHKSQQESKAAASQSAHSRLQTTTDTAAAVNAAASPPKRSSSVLRRTPAASAGAPSLEKELCERLDITWAAALELVAWSVVQLGLDLTDEEAESKHREDILELAAKENTANESQRQQKAKAASPSQSAHSRLQTTADTGGAHAAADAAASPAKRSSSLHRRTSAASVSAGGPSLEKELCERLDITWAAALELVAFSIVQLDLDLTDEEAELQHREDILEIAAEENTKNPRKSRSRLQTTDSGAAQAAAAPPIKRSSSVRRRASTSGPTLEKALCERLDITWAAARELVTWSKESLGLDANDEAAEIKHWEDILEMAAEENRTNPRKSRPKVVKSASVRSGGASVTSSVSSSKGSETKKKESTKDTRKKKGYAVPAHMQAYLDRPDVDDGADSAAIKYAVSGGITSAALRPVTPTESWPRPLKQ